MGKAPLIGVLCLAVLGVAGCVGMPNGGPPNQYTVDQNNTGQGQDFVGPFPAGPLPNASPAQIVQGFLFASASYYTTGSVAKEFLTPAEQNWVPESVTVFHTWDANDPVVYSVPHNNAENTVQISGDVQARLNGAGQLYVSAGQGNTPDVQASQESQSAGSCSSTGSGSSACYSFTLVKSDGQWRIKTLPANLLVEESDFQRGWATQDLYFFDAARQVLVPDSVFVPIGTSESDLLNKLAQALKTPPASWLSGATGANVIPSDVSIAVQSQPGTAVVNLKGTLTSTEQQALPLMAAELVWTLTSSSVSQPPIASVQLQLNGTPWNPNQQLERSTFKKYDPYPSTDASFAYIDQHGIPGSRCGSTANGAVGQATPVFNQAGGTALAQCTASPSGTVGPSGPAPSQSSTPGKTQGKTQGKPGSTTGQPGKHGQPNKPNKPATYSMVAVSPDGTKVAVVSADRDTLSIGQVGGHASLNQIQGPQQGITSISWDRRDDLWLSENGSVEMVPADGDRSFGITSPPDVTALSVAPDGVRVALLLGQNPPGGDSDLELAAINPIGNQGQQQVPGEHAKGPDLGTPVPLGPGIIGSALAWYDADHLMVLGPASTTNPAGELEEVPVDGRAGLTRTPPPTSTGETMESIAAGGSANMLVVGLSGHQLAVSDGTDGPWQAVAAGGSAPSYWIKPAS